MTQINEIKAPLKSGKTITQKGAIELCNAYRLSAIILVLRKNYAIDMKLIPNVTNSGSHAQYKML